MDIRSSVAGMATGFALLLSTPQTLWAQSEVQSAALEVASIFAAKRLIQVGDHAPRWMSRGEVESLRIKQHRAGVCGGFMDITEHQNLEAVPVRRHYSLRRKLPRQQKQVHKLLPHISSQNLHNTVLKLSEYHDRKHDTETGRQAAEWIRDEFVRIGGNRTDVKVELFTHNWKQPSVIARIEGSGAKASELVVIGGHEDSTASSRAPGADDDASGTATVIETFRVLVESGFKPERTLLFMTYAAEELGLWGSQAIANQFKADQKNVVGVIQFDMTMFPGPGTPEIAFFSDKSDPLHKFTKMLVDEYVKIPWTTTSCFGCSSDHASWRRAGYSAVFPFEARMSNSNKKIHTSGDVLDILDVGHGMHFAKLGVAFAVEMGKGEAF